MTAYYNEIDPNAAQWLRNLISAGEIAYGDVDERSIRDVRWEDLRPYSQVHLFAGIGGWSLALRRAGWPDSRPVWTGSCPCQPYSTAGKQEGNEDERNLWPEMYRLLRECRPECVIGEQVEAAVGHGWLDGVSADLETQGYAVGSIVLGAHSAGAPHIRQRLYWCGRLEKPGHSIGPGWPLSGSDRSREGAEADGSRASDATGGSGGTGGLDQSEIQRSQNGPQLQRSHDWKEPHDGRRLGDSGLGISDSAGRLKGESASEAVGHWDSAISTGGALWMGEPIQPGLEGHTWDVGGRCEPGRVDPQQDGSVAEAGGTDRMEHTESDRRVERRAESGERRVESRCGPGRLADSSIERRQQESGGASGDEDSHGWQSNGNHESSGDGADRGRMANPERDGGRPDLAERSEEGRAADGRIGPWSDYELIPCSDGKSRRAQRGSSPLAPGLPRSLAHLKPGMARLGIDPRAARGNRTVQLKGYGNAICVPTATAFIKAFMEIADGHE